jgi:hypothetical protein
MPSLFRAKHFDPEDGGIASCKTPVTIHQSTLHNTPEDLNLHNHRCENLKFRENLCPLRQNSEMRELGKVYKICQV